jgi:hypothetical protein
VEGGLIDVIRECSDGNDLRTNLASLVEGALLIYGVLYPDGFAAATLDELARDCDPERRMCVTEAAALPPPGLLFALKVTCAVAHLVRQERYADLMAPRERPSKRRRRR